MIVKTWHKLKPKLSFICVAFTPDRWTSRVTESYLTVTAHHMTPQSGRGQVPCYRHNPFMSHKSAPSCLGKKTAHRPKQCLSQVYISISHTYCMSEWLMSNGEFWCKRIQSVVIPGGDVTRPYRTKDHICNQEDQHLNQPEITTVTVGISLPL